MIEIKINDYLCKVIEISGSLQKVLLNKKHRTIFNLFSFYGKK